MVRNSYFIQWNFVHGIYNNGTRCHAKSLSQLIQRMAGNGEGVKMTNLPKNPYHPELSHEDWIIYSQAQQDMIKAGF